MPGLANRITPSVLMCKMVPIVCETTALDGYLDTSVVWMRKQMNIENCRNGNKGLEIK